MLAKEEGGGGAPPPAPAAGEPGVLGGGGAPPPPAVLLAAPREDEDMMLSQRTSGRSTKNESLNAISGGVITSDLNLNLTFSSDTGQLTLAAEQIHAKNSSRRGSLQSKLYRCKSFSRKSIMKHR